MSDEITAGVARQYATSERLAARGRLHRNHTVAETPWFEWVAAHLPLTDGARVLDAGCGPGWFWQAGAPALPQRLTLTLADISPGMIAEATTRGRTLRTWTVEGVVADAQALPFPDASFDTVVAMHMLYHVPDQQAAIAEMHRLLKPGGTLAVTTNGAGNLSQLYALTTVFGSDPVDPSGAAFGFDRALDLLGARFGNVRRHIHPGHLRITDAEDVFLALTSYPPGDQADDLTLAAFRAAIADAFAKGGGALVADRQVGLFLSRKA
jgi:SAM-dependent methyltransferase